MQKISFYNSTPIQIRFNDIDLMGHVNNAIMQEYFDLGRMNYLQNAFGELLFKGNQVLIIASIHTDFINQLLITDDVEVKTAIVKIGTKSLDMVQQLVDKNTNEVKVACKSVMVAVDRILHQSIEIPQAWRERIGEIERW